MYLTEDMLKGMAEAGHSIEMYVPVPCRGVSDEVRNEYKKKKTEILYDGKLTIHRFALYKEGRNSLMRAFRYGLLNLIYPKHSSDSGNDVRIPESLQKDTVCI